MKKILLIFICLNVIEYILMLFFTIVVLVVTSGGILERPIYYEVIGMNEIMMIKLIFHSLIWIVTIGRHFEGLRLERLDWNLASANCLMMTVNWIITAMLFPVFIGIFEGCPSIFELFVITAYLSPLILSSISPLRKWINRF